MLQIASHFTQRNHKGEWESIRNGRRQQLRTRRADGRSRQEEVFEWAVAPWWLKKSQSAHSAVGEESQIHQHAQEITWEKRTQVLNQQILRKDHPHERPNSVYVFIRDQSARDDELSDRVRSQQTYRDDSDLQINDSKLSGANEALEGPTGWSQQMVPFIDRDWERGEHRQIQNQL